MLDGAITIGRGAGNRRLSDLAWAEFRQVVVGLAGSYARAIHVRNRGLGQWDDQAEENFVVIFSGMHNSHSTALRPDLGQTAHQYDQDAIALLLGTSELITPLRLATRNEVVYAG